MSDFNDFGFSTVSEDEYRAQQTTQVDTAKEVAKLKARIAEIDKQIEAKQAKIKELEGELEEMRVTRSAIKKFADQNTMLMEKYEEQRKVKDNLEI